MENRLILLLRKIFFLLPVLSVLLSGCISSTRLDQNEELSAEVLGREYGEIYFLTPEQDPRDLSPRVVSELRGMGYNVTEMNRDKPLEGVQGTGFFVSTNGHLLTCAHVLDEATDATVWWDGERYEADKIASDEDLDLALIKLRRLPEKTIEPLMIDFSASPEMGDDVYTMGYPMAQILGDQARLTKGMVSASEGFKGDSNQFQISAPIQPGNSGGPVFNDSGKVRGVVTQTLNTLSIIKASGGAAPQNVNFALKPEHVHAFLGSHLTEDELPVYEESRSISSVKNAVLKVRSGIIPAHLEDKPKLVILFDYNGYWDMWYRFNIFIISAFDFETGERIFSAGQVGDNLISNEEVVIKDTLLEVRNGLGK
jgi:S1-C subfamily serine protease